MANNRITYPKFKAFTPSGGFASGYFLYTYEAGTSTLLTTYQETELTTPHTNPIVLNALGECELYCDEPVKLTLTDADGTVQTGFPVDDVDPSAIDADEVAVTPPAGYVAVNVQDLFTAVAAEIAAVDDSVVRQLLVMPTGTEVTENVTGLDYSMNTTDAAHDIDISVGACKDSTNTSDIILSTAITKQIDAAWAAGTAAGGLLNGAVAANKAYNIYLLLKDSDSSVDAGFLLEGDALATYLPAGYTKYRWIGFVRTNASSNVCLFAMARNVMSMGIASENVIATIANNGIANSAVVDHSTFMPVSKVSKIGYGVSGTAASTGILGSTLDGTNGEYLLGMGDTTYGDTSVYAWSYQSTGSPPGLIPYKSTREFFYDAVSCKLLGQQFELRR